MDAFDRYCTVIVAQMKADGVVEVNDTHTRYHRLTEDNHEENFVVENDGGEEVFSGTEEECKQFMENPNE